MFCKSWGRATSSILSFTSGSAQANLCFIYIILINIYTCLTRRGRSLIFELAARICLGCGSRFQRHISTESYKGRRFPCTCHRIHNRFQWKGWTLHSANLARLGIGRLMLLGNPVVSQLVPLKEKRTDLLRSAVPELDFQIFETSSHYYLSIISLLNFTSIPGAPASMKPHPVLM